MADTAPPSDATLPTSSSAVSLQSRHSFQRPTVRVLSSEEDLATRPPSSHARSPSPGPDFALSSLQARPPTPTMNALGVLPGASFVNAQRRASAGGLASGSGAVGPAFVGAAGFGASSSSPGERPLATMFDTLPAHDGAQPSGRTTPTPNALLPRLRNHGPLITRVASPMDPSFSQQPEDNTSLRTDSTPRVVSTSPEIAARPVSPLSTFSRRSSIDMLSALGSSRPPTAPLSEEDVVANLAAGGTFAREHNATARRASEDSLAHAAVQDSPAAPTPVPGYRNEMLPFTSFKTSPSGPSTSTSVPTPAPHLLVGHTPLHLPPFAPVLSPHTSRPLRKYRLHAGRNRFLLGGRLLTSGDNPLPLVGSLAVAFVLPCAWWAFNGRFLWREWGGAGKAGVFVFVYVVLIMWSSMLKTAFTDPGILPRNLDPTPARKWVAATRSQSEGEGEGEGAAELDGEWCVEPRWLRVKDGGVVSSKWCETCHTYRPPRTSHCRLCDNCVERTDHHCAFLNNCIGQRNYLPFIAFLASSVLAGLYSLAFSAYHISQRASPPAQLREWDTIGAMVVLVATGAFLVPVAGLAGYHAKLVWTNRTTIEMLRPAASRASLDPLTADPLPGHPNPWARRSGARNALAVLCAPGALTGKESWVDARGWAGRDAREEVVAGEGRRRKGAGGGDWEEGV